VSKLKAVLPPLLLGVTLIAAVIFIFSGVSIFPAGSSPPPQPAGPTTALPSSITPSPAPSPSAPGTADDTVVATVNDRRIYYKTWQEATSLDRVMDGLAGHSAPSAEETLERLINEILVLQAANLEGATVAEADIEKRIAALETAWKVSDEQVATALQEAGLERQALVRRTGRLLLVEQGLATIAAERGDANAWLVQARREAQIGLYMPLASSPAPPSTTLRAGPSITPGAGGETEPPPTEPAALATAPQPGALAPDFKLSNLQGQAVSLRSLRGRPVLINFWATWCPPCRSELPALRSAYAQYHEQGLEILAVDVKEDSKTVAAFATELELTFPILLDDKGIVAAIYQVRGTPTSLFVGPDGVVAARHLGPLDQKTLADYLAPLVTGQDKR
jgi:peroxiredoxin